MRLCEAELTPARIAMAASARTLIGTYYDCFNRADWEGMLALLADDVAHDINQGGRELGKDAFRRFLSRMDGAYREEIVELVILTEESGRRAATEYLVSGTYLKTDQGLPPARGQTYRLAGGAFFDIADGRIQRVANYYNLQEWLRQIV
jgi:steroid delta-isomerase-like uncharacterized protein